MRKDKLTFSREHHYSVQIFYEDTDFSGVVYHAHFLRYFERAREQVIGANLLKQLWQQQGLGFAVYRADMICHQGIEFADIVDKHSNENKPFLIILQTILQQSKHLIIL